MLQQAVWNDDYSLFRQYSAKLDGSERKATLRSLMDLRSDRAPIPLDEVESEDTIVKRFKTGARSYGSLSKEAHECLGHRHEPAGR